MDGVVQVGGWAGGGGRGGEGRLSPLFIRPGVGPVGFIDTLGLGTGRGGCQRGRRLIPALSLILLNL